MWKKVSPWAASFLLIAGIASASSPRQKYPLGILGEDFGILQNDDLAVNTCDVSVVPFSESSTVYPYWQCFEVSGSKLFCDGNGYDESERTRLTILVVSGKREGELHEYISTRAFPLAACREFVKDWQRLVKGERHVCVSGSFNSRDKNEAGEWVSHWTFDRFKTRKGCESYFFGGCRLRYQLRHGCKLNGGT